MKTHSRRFRPRFYLAGLGLAALLCSAAHAHEPFMDCFEGTPGEITCMAGYEDGTPLTDRDIILIKDRATGKNLLEGQFDADGRYVFPRPETDFMMVFIGSAIGHTRRIDSADLPPP